MKILALNTLVKANQELFALDLGGWDITIPPGTQGSIEDVTHEDPLTYWIEWQYGTSHVGGGVSRGYATPDQFTVIQ